MSQSSRRSSLKRSTRRASKTNSNRRQLRQSRRAKLAVESLENRHLLTTFAINSTGDFGDANTADGICDDGTGAASTPVCSLRAAIEQANALAGADEIEFNIGAGAQTISLSSPLPAITDATTIDGSTQPGFTGAPLINMDAGGLSVGISLNANDSTLKNFQVSNASFIAVNLHDADNTLIDGLELSDVAAAFPSDSGIISQLSDNLTIQNVTATDKITAINVSIGSDLQVVDNDLSRANTSLIINGVGANAIPGGLYVEGNTFFDSVNGVTLQAMSGLTVSDGSVFGSHVILEDNSGLDTMIRTGLQLYDVDNSLVADLNLSDTLAAIVSGDSGIVGNGNDDLTIRDVSATDKQYGIRLNNSSDLTILDNDLSTARTHALWLDTITGNALPGGVSISGNTFGGDQVSLGPGGIFLGELPDGLIISNGSVPGSHVILEDNNGLASVPGVRLQVNGTDDLLVDDVNYIGAEKGVGIRVGSGDNVTVRNVSTSNTTGSLEAIAIFNATNVQVVDNDILGATLLISDVDPSGLLVQNNTFGGGKGVRLHNMSNLIVSDGSVAGSHVILEDTSGFNDITGFSKALTLVNVNDSTVEALDFSNPNPTISGTGLAVFGADGLTVQNIEVSGRSTGMDFNNNVTNLQLSCSIIQNNGRGINVMDPSNLIFDNDFSGNGNAIVAGANPVNAMGNYWGAADGPSTDGGSGDPYSGNVDASNFLTSLPSCLAPLDTEVALTGGVLAITDANGGDSDDALSISYSGGTYTITDTGGLTIDVSSVVGSTGSGTSTVTVPDSGVTGVSFDTLAGDDTITVDSVQPSFSGDFTIVGGTGSDTAIVNGTAQIATTGSGSVNIDVTRNIVLNSGAGITTVDGDLTLTANTNGTAVGTFAGIDLVGAVVEVTGTGQLMLDGHGGDTGGSNYGVAVRNGSQAIGGTNAVMVDGNGGDTAGNTVNSNYGVYVVGAGSMVTSGGGDVSVTGTGGGVDDSERNFGVGVESGGRITAGGMGVVNVTGDGGNTAGTGDRNYGVFVTGASSQISSAGGDVAVIGMGGGAGTSLFSFNVGTSVENGGEVTAGGLGNVTVVGTGGNTAGSFNHGVQVSGQITSAAGDVSVTGTGGGVGASGTNVGVYVTGAGKITAGNVGTVTVVGDGGNVSGTGSSNLGIQIRNGGEVTSGGGDVLITGTGGGGVSPSQQNHGVSFQSVGKASAGGTGSVTMIGVAGGATGSSGNWGIDLNNSQITSSGGHVSVTGTGGGASNGFNNAGVWIQSNGEVTAGLTGEVTVVGNGSPTTTSNFNPGVRVETGGQITSGGGDVSVTGTGGSPTGSGAKNYGIDVQRTGKITAGLIGRVTVEGFGGNASGTGGGHDGVHVTDQGLITSSGGDVMVTGTGGGGANNGANAGVRVVSGFSGPAEITAGGMGSVTVVGNGGSDTPGFNSTSNIGVSVEKVDSKITSSGGTVTVNGTGGGTGSGANNHGVIVIDSAEITSGGTGDVSINGTEGNVGSDAMKVETSGTVSGDGQISLDGSGSILLTSGASISGLADLTVDTTTLATFDAGTTSTISGTTTFSSGRTNVDGLIDTNSSLVTVQSGATLGGNGTIDRPIAVDPGGTLAPGLDTGILTVDALDLSATSIFEVEIGGTDAGIGSGFHDQVDVAGLVTISGATLNLSSLGGFTPTVGDEFTIIDNDGTDAVVGSFVGLPQGATISNFLGSGEDTQITYTAGDGNDVVLIVGVVNAPPEIATQSFNIDENQSTVGSVIATDPDLPADTQTFSLTGNGPDDALFTITSSGYLSFIVPPDFENPNDVGGTPSDNVYEVAVQVEDSAGETATAILNVIVDPVNDNAPNFTSPTAVSVDENTTAVQTISATDADQPAQIVSFSITGNGADDAKFQVTGGSQLEFVAPPNFEAPTDADVDNVYAVEVEANDSNGLTTTQTVLVTVSNINPTLPTDIDATINGAAEGAATGTIAGVTASAMDPVGPVVVYSLTDDAGGRFQIEPSTGVVTVNDGSLLDGPATHTITVQASDGVGGTSTSNFDINVTNVDPEIVTLESSATFADKASLDGDTVLTNVGQASAGYQNSYGYYIKGSQGEPTSGEIIWSDMQQNIGEQVVLTGIAPESIGYFIIPNGQTLNPSLANQTPVTFQQDTNNDWVAVTAGGDVLEGQGADAFFSKKQLNPDNKKHVQDSDAAGNQNWEDLVGGGDRDFNDVNVNQTQAALVTVSGSFSDAGLADTHAVTIDWGDGTETILADGDPAIDQVNNSFEVSHQYTTGGIFTVKATVADDDGGASTEEKTNSVVSGVRLTPGGELQIVGTELKDHVAVKRLNVGGDPHFKVTANLGIPGGGGATTHWFAADQVDGIRIILCEGDDHAIVGDGGQSIDLPTIVKGNGGDDQLIGGNGPDRIVGGGGNDRIFGRGGDDNLSGNGGDDNLDGGSGNDILRGNGGDDRLEGDWGLDVLVGGNGLDNLRGGFGQDIVIGARMMDESALSDVRSAWTDGSSYSDRVAALTAVGGLLEANAKVLEDNAKDTLRGNLGHDLFFASLSGATKDSVKDKFFGDELLELL